jgi:hypothetical protein
MPHYFCAAPALGLAALVLLGLAVSPASAQDAPPTPTVTTPSPATPQTPTAPTTTTPVPSPSPTAAAPPPKQTPVAPAPNISVSGEIDGYYQYQTSSPTHGQVLNGRIYAFRQNTPTLRLAWLDVYHTPSPGGFGFKVSLAAGDAADRDVPDANSGVGESRFKNVAQAYGSYTASNGFNIDFGKFLSPYGYDTTEATLNYNYTLTDATYLVPNYLTGVRATYPVKGIHLAVSAFVVNSLEETPTAGVQDDNGRKDYILRLNYTTPDGKFSYIPAYGTGSDKLSATGNENITLFDNWLTYHATKAVTLAGEYVYRKDHDDGGGYNLRGDGYGAYLRQQLTPKNAYALRYSVLAKHTDTAGSVASFQANEVTATFEHKVAANFTTRLEYRYDHSNNPALFGFAKGNRPDPVSSQNTILVAGLFTY